MSRKKKSIAALGAAIAEREKIAQTRPPQCSSLWRLTCPQIMRLSALRR